MRRGPSFNRPFRESSHIPSRARAPDAVGFGPLVDFAGKPAHRASLRQSHVEAVSRARACRAKLDDQGSQGDWPSHPHLLDWLAGQFIDSGWDVKHTVKLIVMSGTYRQSSALRADLARSIPTTAGSPGRDVFVSMPKWSATTRIKLAGLLSEKVGGPSVKPYQPRGYWAYLNFPPREWQNGTGNELYRRSLYTHWQRQYLHPAMLAFDAPGREECTADRPLEHAVAIARVDERSGIRRGGPRLCRTDAHTGGGDDRRTLELGFPSRRLAAAG